MGSYDITTDTTGDMDSNVDSNAFENFTYIEVKKIMKIADLRDISHVMRIEDFLNLQFSFKCILEK